MANPHPKPRKGVPNKTTTEFRKFANSMWQSYIRGDDGPKWSDDILQMAPSDRAKYMLKMAEFIAPRMQATTVKVEDGSNPLTLTQTKLLALIDCEQSATAVGPADAGQTPGRPAICSVTEQE